MNNRNIKEVPRMAPRAYVWKQDKKCTRTPNKTLEYQDQALKPSGKPKSTYKQGDSEGWKNR